MTYVAAGDKLFLHLKKHITDETDIKMTTAIITIKAALRPSKKQTDFKSIYLRTTFLYYLWTYEVQKYVALLLNLLSSYVYRPCLVFL